MSGILTVYHGKELCNCNLRGRINVANVSTSTAVPSVIVRTCFVVFSQYLYDSASFLVLRSNYEAEKVGNALSKSSLNKSRGKIENWSSLLKHMARAHFWAGNKPWRMHILAGKIRCVQSMGYRGICNGFPAFWLAMFFLYNTMQYSITQPYTIQDVILYNTINCFCLSRGVARTVTCLLYSYIICEFFYFRRLGGLSYNEGEIQMDSC